jgi:hypothetical protein
VFSTAFHVVELDLELMIFVLLAQVAAGGTVDWHLRRRPGLGFRLDSIESCADDWR